MKKYKKIAYVFLVILVISFAFVVFKSYGNSNKKGSEKEKTLAEIDRVEYGFLNMFNELNNIKFENYKINTSEIKEEASNNSSETNSTGSSSSGKSEESSSKSENKSNQDSKQSNENEKYEMKQAGVLTRDFNIDWENLKNEVEMLYPTITSLTIDLYKINVNKDKISSFNSKYDNLMKNIKEENKEETLNTLSKLYDHLPNFVENATDDENKKVVIKTKNNIFKAYSILEKDEWDEISDNINSANQEFTKLLTTTQKNDKKQYIINKIYIQINELKNTAEIKDKEIFLIKYKNLLEEIENL